MSATDPAKTSAATTSNNEQTQTSPQKITAFLSFDTNAEEAANFYVSVFKDARIINTARYTEAGPRPEGSVMIVDFELQGVRYTALNGGPEFKFNQGISLLVHCQTQDEVDYYWEKLSEGGETLDCGWLKDKFGVSWQITPDVLLELIQDSDRAKAARVMKAMMTMQKIDIKQIEEAARAA
jgi:predicted 3-demethylubiquinone-9 3-methyltransferase (glyoxalase superfamily)